MQSFDKYRTLSVVPFEPDEKVLAILLRANSNNIQRWKRREDDMEWIGIGSAIRMDTAHEAQQTLRAIANSDSDATKLLRCFAALPFEREEWGRRLRWIYPKWTLVRQNGTWRGFGIKRETTSEYDPQKELNILTKAYITGVPPRSDRHTHTEHECTRPEWNKAIETIRERIAANRLHKAVLARSEHLSIHTNTKFDTIFDLLKSGFPNCDCFLVPVEDGWFVGATPERLFQIEGDAISVDALAGTRARGATPAEDDTLTTELLSDEKELLEHKIVVDWIVKQLNSVCHSVQFDSFPVVRKYPTVQHLYTRITGTLNPTIALDHIIASLHPTPAIGGEPQSEALAILRKVEKCNRGYFGGIVGVVGCNEVECSVGIRSMLITEHLATFYAGTGIVAQSNAKQEWEETKWKMSAMKDVFEKALHDSHE